MSTGADQPHGDLKRVAASSFLGNFIEWFDYATYTYFAITIGIVFFPESEVNSTLLAVPWARCSGAIWATRRAASSRSPFPFC